MQLTHASVIACMRMWYDSSESRNDAKGVFLLYTEDDEFKRKTPPVRIEKNTAGSLLSDRKTNLNSFNQPLCNLQFDYYILTCSLTLYLKRVDDNNIY